MWEKEEDETAAHPESQRLPSSSEENSEAVAEVYIPDYVMHDFGVPKVVHPAKR